MNFDNAIVAHTTWKNKLKAYFEKGDGSLNSADVQSDQKCELGQWIHGEGSKWNQKPAFIELQKRHAQFHVAAAALVRKVDAGQLVDDDVNVGSGSEFSKSTAAVVKALVKLRDETY
jgi:hypothetical protein